MEVSSARLASCRESEARAAPVSPAEDTADECRSAKEKRPCSRSSAAVTRVSTRRSPLSSKPSPSGDAGSRYRLRVCSFTCSTHTATLKLSIYYFPWPCSYTIAKNFQGQFFSFVKISVHVQSTLYIRTLKGLFK